MFTEQQRRIFGPYHDGEKEVYADPLKVYRRLHYQLEGVPNKTIKDTRSEDLHVRTEARDKLVAAAVYAFDLVPFDAATGKGVLTEDVEKVLADYLEWLEKNGSREAKQRTSSPVMGMHPFSVPAPSTTPNMSPSTSISPDCGCKKSGS
jgi:hypothetical protein